MKRFLGFLGWLLANALGWFLVGLLRLGDAINLFVMLLVATVCVIVNVGGIVVQCLGQLLCHPRHVLRHGFRGDERLIIS